MSKGIFCISIDTELLWGRKDLDYKNFIGRTKEERKIIKKLLSMFMRYNVPTTWAVVGKLKEKGNDLWSGIDILNWIKKDKIHEIASHTYSHEIMTEISSDEAEKEIKKNKSKSFVFPRNKIKHIKLLKKYGFISYRDEDKSKYELLIPRIPPTGKAEIRGGIVKIPSSMYFVSARGFRRYIPYNLRFVKSKLGMDKAINKGEIFHIWFHPADFVDNSKNLFSEMEKILVYANKKRREGKMDIMTMGDIARKTIKI